MAEVSFNTSSAAARYRDLNEARRARDEARQASETQLQNRVDEVLRRNEIAAAEARRTERNIRDRRNDREAEQQETFKLKGQQQVLDTIDGDTRYRLVRDEITIELNAARDDEEALQALVDSQLEEALALDAVDDFRDTANSPPDLRTFLADRDQRLTLRQQQARDFDVQQRIDLRIADDNIRAANPNDPTPRGSIVDVSG